MGKFRVGDKVRCVDGNPSEHNGSGWERGAIFTVGLIAEDIIWPKEGTHSSKCGVYDHALELVTNEGVDMEETKAPAEFVRVERNTELFKKGAIFQYNSSYKLYKAKDGVNALIDMNNYMTVEVPLSTVQRLPKVFVEVIKFNPEFVSLDENERLQQVLAAKPAAKKAVKKTKKA